MKLEISLVIPIEIYTHTETESTGKTAGPKQRLSMVKASRSKQLRSLTACTWSLPAPHTNKSSSCTQ